MTIKASGSSLAASEINTEIGRSSTAFFNLNGLEERYLAASGIVSEVDGDFNTLGFSGALTGMTVFTTSIQSDGKIVVGGIFERYGNTAISCNRIARLHSNGDFDNDFSIGTGFNGFVVTTAIQSDGRIITGGTFTSYSGTARSRIARLHSNGVLDTGFNVGTGAGNTVNTTSIQSDGKIIIGGAFTSYSGTTISRIARLHSNGVLDTSFNVGTGANSSINTTSIQSDGKIIIGGVFTTYSGTARSRIARLHSNGVLDTDFNVGTGANSTVFSSAIQLDGKVIIGGQFTSYSGVERNRLARLHSNGILDEVFDKGGTSLLRAGTINTISIQSDGKIVYGGNFQIPSRITRINTELYRNPEKTISNSIISFNDFYSKTFIPVPGTLDDTFNIGTGANSSVYTTSIQSDGRVIIGGVFTLYSGTARSRIARLHSNGVLDTDFNVGTGASSFVYTTSIQSDGRVIIGGQFTLYSGTARSRIARLHSNGVLDTDFNVGTGANSTVCTTSIQSDGRVIIGGIFTLYSGTARSRIARLHSNGVLDTSFNVGTGANATVLTTPIQSDGKVIIGGDFTLYSGTARSRIARLHSNGVLDTDFNVGTGADAPVLTTPIQSDGKVIIGGFFTSYSGTTTNYIARLHSNGLLDTDFNVGTGAGFTVCTTSIQSDGKIIIGGNFTSYSNSTISRIARLHSNGVLDTSFNVGTGANATVLTTSIQSDGRVIIGGDFTLYSGTARSRISRINAV